jgi:hypothetical protein
MGYPWAAGQTLLAADLNSAISDLYDAVDDRKVYVCTSATRPAHAAGRTILETDTGRRGISDGTYWLLTKPEAWCQVWQESAQTLSHMTNTELNLSGTTHDGETSWHSGNRINAPWAGVYEVDGSAIISSNGGDTVELDSAIYANGTALYGAFGATVTPSSSWLDPRVTHGPRVVSLAASEYVHMYVYQWNDSSDAIDTVVSTAWRSMLRLKYLYTKET